MEQGPNTSSTSQGADRSLTRRSARRIASVVVVAVITVLSLIGVDIAGRAVAGATDVLSITNLPTAAVAGGSFAPDVYAPGYDTTGVTVVSGPCTVSGANVTFDALGFCSLESFGDSEIAGPFTFTIYPALPITNPPTDATPGSSFTPNIQNDSGYDSTSATVASGPCTAWNGYFGLYVVYTGVGTCSLETHGDGSNPGGIYSFTIYPTLTIANIPTDATVGGSFTPIVLAPGMDTSGVTVLSGPCTVSGADVTFDGVGTCSLQSFGDSQIAGPFDFDIAAGSSITAPDAPTNVSAIAGDAEATVSWIAPANDGGSAITGYTVSDDSGDTCTTQDTSCVVPDLINGESYTFTVVATNAEGDSTPSTPSTAITLTSNTAVITSASSATLAAGKTLKFTVTTSGTPAATLTATGLPSWMTFTPSGKAGKPSGNAALRGSSPVGGGVYSFTIHANNGVGPDTTQVFTMNVLGFTSSATANFTKGASGTFAITTSLPSAVIAATLKVTGAQQGLTFTNNGNGTATISGTPGAKAKTASVKVTATVGTVVVTQKLLVTIG